MILHSQATLRKTCLVALPLLLGFLIPALALALPPVYSADPLHALDRNHQGERLIWRPAREAVILEKAGLETPNSGLFAVPAPGYLRWQGEDESRPPRLWLSRDARLWQAVAWTTGTESGEWFHIANASEAGYARLEGANNGRLLVAEPDPIDAPDTYRPLDLPLPKVRLYNEDGSQVTAYELPAENAVYREVKGPAVLALASRPGAPAYYSDPPRSGLEWQLDGSDWQPTDPRRPQLTPNAQRRDTDSCLLHGDMERRYLVIPKGRHRLGLRARNALLISLEHAERHAYFLESNAPEPTVEARTRQLLNTPLAHNGNPLAEIDALARSNHLEGAADLALARLAPAPGTQRDPVADALAANIEFRQRFFRNLYPDAEPTRTKAAWFSAVAPGELLDAPRYFLSNAFQDARQGSGIFDQMSKGAFVSLGTSPTSYPLPPREGPSRLRLAVATPFLASGATLRVRYDDGPARLLALDPDGLEVDSPQEALLSHLQKRIPPTLEGLFAAHREPGHHLPVASIELDLPRHVARVRVEASHPVKLALQYRASQPFVADESAYLKALESQPPVALVAHLHQRFQAVADPASRPLPTVISSERALANQWYPLLRELHAAQSAWLDHLHPENSPPSPVRLEARLGAARKAAANEQWLEVMEALGSLGYGQNAEAYRLSQQALKALDEHFTALRQRQAAALLGADSQARELATQDLLTQYQATQDWNSQIRLLAARFLREGDPTLLNPLGQALHQSGEPLWATQLGLVLARLGQAPNWLALAAFDAEWPIAADQALATLPPTRRAYLLGEQAARRGRDEEAARHWKAAGVAGQKALSRLQQARNIAAALATPGRAAREAAVERWLAWSLDSDKGFEWHSLTAEVTQSAGFATLESEVTRKPLVLPRATAQAPVEIEVVGPRILRVQARRLDPDNSPEDLDWLVAEIAGERRLHPLPAQPINPYLAPLAGQPTTSIADDVLLRIPPGLQRLRLQPQTHAHLFQIDQWQPKSRWAILPPVMPLALRALLSPAGSFQAPSGDTRQRPDYRLISDCRAVPLPVLPAESLYTHGLIDAGGLEPAATPALAHSLAGLRFPARPVEPPGWPPGSHAVALETPLPSPADPVPDAEQTHARAMTLLWEMQQKPQRHDELAARIARLTKPYTHLPALRDIRDKALEGLSWQLQPTSLENAGVLPLPFEKQWQAPFSRVRKALLDETNDAFFLHGRDTRGLTFDYPQPVALTLALEQKALPYNRRIPATVMVQIDDSPPRRVTLDEPRARLPLSFDEGVHALRLWLEEPAQQQFVSARLRRTDAPLSPLEEEAASDRLYHIASPSQPVRFQLKGPAWVRIEQWRPGGTPPRYRYIEPGLQTLVLSATDKDRYYRLYALREAPESPPLASRTRQETLAAPAEGPKAPELPTPLAWQAHDSQEPGATPGSPGFYLHIDKRLAGSDDAITSVQDSGSIEGGLRYRKRLDHPLGLNDTSIYSQSDLFLRHLEGGQSLFGARQWLDIYPAQRPWTLQLYGEAQVQPGSISGVDDRLWSAQLQTRLAREYELSPTLDHEPELVLDQHWLSLDSVPASALDNIDPDIFTPYTADHRRSLSLGDRLTWWPWRDQRWYLEGAVVSNEDLNLLSPDHWRLEAAAGQLFGPLAAEAGMRYRHYLADDDRESSLDRSDLFLSLDWLRWGKDSNALALGAEVSYDIQREATRWQLNFSLDDNQGRLSPFMRPDEMNFVNLRRAQQRSHVDTNRLTPLYVSDATTADRAAPPPASHDVDRYLQVVALSTQASALALRERLDRQLGAPTRLVNRGGFYRVQVGANAQDVEALRQQLTAMGFADTFMVAIPSTSRETRGTAIPHDVDRYLQVMALSTEAAALELQTKIDRKLDAPTRLVDGGGVYRVQVGTNAQGVETLRQRLSAMGLTDTFMVQRD
ncbi:SPOR domain-containing protein [Vreelandella massiliensis]|uniref:SPOR domain-containing protein n=1 Tax=Vreelandella massiliensis TaxID=1816686 RepID=UPI00096A662B|nr:SPOR domain-containing protein [Halomonas massiliensis]